MKTFTASLLLAASVAALAPSISTAQIREGEFETIDRIVAVVGNMAIAESKLTEELNTYFAATGEVPDSSSLEQLRREILERMIDEEVLVQAALADTTVVVSDQEVNAAVNETMRRVREQFTTTLQFETELRAAGFENEQRYREYQTERQRREMLRSALISAKQQRGEVNEIPPNLDEMLEYFEATRAQWPQRPATVNFRQIAIRPQPDSAANAAARRLADSIVVELRGGADFATMARRFSEDPGSRQQGGDLGFFRRGVMHRDFERVAFRIRPNVISDPVATPFGVHIIEVTRVAPAEVQARHILIIPELTEANQDRARALADSVMGLLRAGARMDSLRRRFHDDSEQPVIEDAPREGLPPAYTALLEDASPGDLIGPAPLEVGSITKFVIIRFVGSRPAGEPSFEDVQDRIRSALARENGIRKYVRGLRANGYIDIRL